MASLTLVKLKLKQRLKRLIGAQLAIAERKLASILFQEDKSTAVTAEPNTVQCTSFTGTSTKLPRAQVVKVKKVPNNDILLKIEMVHGLIDTGDLEKVMTVTQELIQAFIGVSDEEIGTITIAKRLCNLGGRLGDISQTTLATQLVDHALDMYVNLKPDEQLDGLWHCVLVADRIFDSLVENEMTDGIETLLPTMKKVYRSMNAIYHQHMSTSQRVDKDIYRELYLLKTIGQMNLELNNYELCVSYCEKALSFVEDFSNYTPYLLEIFGIWCTCGTSYKKEERWSKAAASFKHALDIYKEAKSCNRIDSDESWNIQSVRSAMIHVDLELSLLINH